MEREPGEYIDLNPDIEYFLRKLIPPIDENLIEDRNTTHLVPHLSAERIAFLDKMIEERNFQAVRDTTNECKPR